MHLPKFIGKIALEREVMWITCVNGLTNNKHVVDVNWNEDKNSFMKDMNDIICKERECTLNESIYRWQE